MSSEATVGVVIVAAGSSTRMEGVDKTFAPLLGRPLISHTLDPFEEWPVISQVALVLSADSVEAGRSVVQEHAYRKISRVVAGGARRQDSVKAGIDALKPCRWVMVHDGARPGVDIPLLERALAAADTSPHGAAIAGVPVKDTIKTVDASGRITGTPPRESLWAAQTPQIFAYDVLCRAHAQFQGEATDDAMMVESLGYHVTIFPGSYENLKVTTPEDLVVMEAILQARASG